MSGIKNIHLILLFSFGLCSLQNTAQNTKESEEGRKKISLDAVVAIASKSSLDAFKAKQQYGASYWQFRSFKASTLPKVGLELEPLTYNKSVLKRYDSENNIDVYRPQQNLNSYANISINQNIEATGATLFANSSFSRLANFGLIDSEDFTATPIQIGVIQPIMAFNRFKWAHKISPLQFERAKKQYLYELQDIKLKAVNYFFNWASASKRVELAQENVVSTQKLFNIGKKRYDLGSIEKDDVLNLELDVYNAETNLTQNKRELQKAEAELKLFLRDESPLYSVPELPELISDLQIDVKEATALAEANNPEIFNLKIKRMEAERDLDKVIKENRFDLSLRGSYGLNQNANTFRDAYGRLLEQQMIAIQMNIPILDWGERKGNIKTAKMNNEVSEIAVQQESDKLSQQLSLKIIDFNLQRQLVTVALRTSEISKSSYDVTEKRFLSGSIDLLRLTSARKAWQTASENYITSLYNYWKFYYEVQQLTLYDFQNKSTISKNFDEILEK
ncbi:TolC family protein [Flavobacterium magnesitis]|uniref:TolC family protein n=1 Tax=Flavobacterium magnesitis TaxID=3138077 RepID=UPI00358F0B82